LDGVPGADASQTANLPQGRAAALAIIEQGQRLWIYATLLTTSEESIMLPANEVQKWDEIGRFGEPRSYTRGAKERRATAARKEERKGNNVRVTPGPESCSLDGLERGEICHDR
jgi:hypothetical protein